MPGPISLPYTPYPVDASPAFPSGTTAYRPILIVDLVVPASGQSLKCFGLVDSGADECTFPLSFATALGLDVTKMATRTTSGVGNASNTSHYENLLIEIPFADGTKLSFTTYAGFTAGLDAIGMGLLGQTGFFENFRVHMDYKVKAFAIERL